MPKRGPEVAQGYPVSDRQYKMCVDLVVVCVAAVALSLPALSTCDPLFVLSAPSILRVNTPEKVFVEAQDYIGPDQNVKIMVMNYPKKNVELTSTTVTLNRANQYMVLADITIQGGKDHFVEDDTLNQYVYLRAQFPSSTLEKVVLVSFQSGYIFVQTDKTIYTPSSTVMYRVFSLSPVMKPVESNISVEIMTPDGITLTKDVIFPSRGVMSGQHKLPEVASLGIWKVVTRFQSTPQKNFTAEFEVKEYVLPSFEVFLTTAKPFFYVGDEELIVDIVARYLYKKDVTGVGFVSFGGVNEKNEKEILASSLQRVEICEGKGKAVLKREHITNINNLLSIYVTVRVLTKTGSEMVEAEKQDIRIAYCPYTVHFNKMPNFFKPGMPFDALVSVTNPDGTPAGNVALVVSERQVTTNSDGMARVIINTLNTERFMSIHAKREAVGFVDPLCCTASFKCSYIPRTPLDCVFSGVYFKAFKPYVLWALSSSSSSPSLRRASLGVAVCASSVAFVVLWGALERPVKGLLEAPSPVGTGETVPVDPLDLVVSRGAGWVWVIPVAVEVPVVDGVVPLLVWRWRWRRFFFQSRRFFGVASREVGCGCGMRAFLDSSFNLVEPLPYSFPNLVQTLFNSFLHPADSEQSRSEHAGRYTVVSQIEGQLAGPPTLVPLILLVGGVLPELLTGLAPSFGLEGAGVRSLQLPGHPHLSPGSPNRAFGGWLLEIYSSPSDFFTSAQVPSSVIPFTISGACTARCTVGACDPYTGACIARARGSLSSRRRIISRTLSSSRGTSGYSLSFSLYGGGRGSSMGGAPGSAAWVKHLNYQTSHTISAYETDSDNYLHVDVGATNLAVGDSFKVNFNLAGKDSNQNQELTYLILNKGQLVQAERFKRQGQSVVTMSLPVTKDMVPSFRIVAYYHVGSSEVVSDSVWVDVKDTCMGTLKVEPSHPVAVYSPHQNFSLKITGDPGARVGLVAVDKGVYVLNNKHRLTQTKIWDVVEKHDTGCTFGSGQNSMWVFHDAGLVFQTNTDKTTPERSVYDDDFYVESEEISSRSEFPESWLWEEEDLPECPAENKQCTTTSLTKTASLKDSITSWQVISISVSKTYGICVADPYDMVVSKDFFIDLKLPYSAVRNEQIEIKAILYNYIRKKIKVRVEIMKTKDVCSMATKKGKYRTTIEIDAMTSRAVPFVIIPMQLGKHTIEVKAAVYDEVITDGVKKDLLVVAEGMRSELQVAKVVLNPSKHGGTQVEEILNQIPRKQVPGTPANTYFTVSANQISQTIEKAITGDSLGSLIVQPRGCGEQNMIYMTLPLIATHYLDTTYQWEKVGLEKRATAIKYINMGYQQELAFRKPDGAFAVWADKPGSAWLTAYVAKVFAMARDIISIEEKVVCDALKWLVLNSQQPNGIFKETFNVYHAEMVGDVRGSDADASMTAFVLIAMQEGSELCSKSVTSLPGSIKKATDYLEGRLKTLSNPYAVAMVSYALANVGKLNQEVLLKHAFEDRTHWPVKSNKFFTLEATAYALLALVKAKEFEKAAPIVHWLNEQQFYGGGYGSTQSTIMVFQAVAEYSSQVKQQQKNLEVEIKVSGCSTPIKWTIDNSNAYVTRSGKMDLNQNLIVNATGTGEATLSVMTLYYAMPEEVTVECTAFDLKVKLDKQDNVTYPGAKESYMLTIDILYLSKERDSTMSILDIGILTGFVVDETDLTKLSTGADRFIQRFEMDKMLSEKGSLILYLDQVSHITTGSVAFRIHKVMEVGLLQPAAVTVYEYLDMENRCVKFYHPVKNAGELNRLCQKDLCQCAEEGCCEKKSGSVKDTDRSKSACGPGMDYMYKVSVEKMDLTHHTDVYHMKVNQVVKEGTDFGVEGHTREFIAQPNCRSKVALQQGKSYLIMGHHDVVQVGSSFKYLLGHATWLEYWPTREEAQTPEYVDTFVALEGLSHHLSTGVGLAVRYFLPLSGSVKCVEITMDTKTLCSTANCALQNPLSIQLHTPGNTDAEKLYTGSR
ncbi:complement C3-like [Alosa pseudoharengus]|uniref:complement C3-like n=1 Tax=Alosa pseudoharengus TaxID=34774 RepID=UPI003F8A7ED2